MYSGDSDSGQVSSVSLTSFLYIMRDYNKFLRRYRMTSSDWELIVVIIKVVQIIESV